jgi:hypothetical protein
LDICNGSNPYPNRGQTSPNEYSATQIDGTMSVIDNSQPTSCAEGAVNHELMLGVGFMEFENASDPGGASSDNNPLNSACWPNSYDYNADYTWYQGAGE